MHLAHAGVDTVASFWHVGRNVKPFWYDASAEGHVVRSQETQPGACTTADFVATARARASSRLEGATSQFAIDVVLC